MRLLLDTHVFVWWLADEQLSPVAAEAISSADAEVLVSAASVWEAEVKAVSGKLDLNVDLIAEASDNGFAELPVRFEHARAAGRLPLHHHDPFDRVLVAQAQIEGLTLVTRDSHLVAYDVRLLAA